MNTRELNHPYRKQVKRGIRKARKARRPVHFRTGLQSIDRALDNNARLEHDIADVFGETAAEMRRRERQTWLRTRCKLTVGCVHHIGHPGECQT